MQDCPDCGRVLGPKAEKCPCGWTRTKPKGFVQDTRAYDIANRQRPWEDVERDARATAIRFGVDPNLPPRARCMAVARATGLLGVLPRAARDAGDDLEEDAYR